jgi:hypothetical protein
MPVPTWISNLVPRSPAARQLVAAAAALIVGAAILPALIYAAGSLLLGRYDGASLSQTYGTVFSGLGAGSVASWIVLLGPYALYQLQRGLRILWRVGGDPP